MSEVLMECYRGSIAHGMYVPNTDPDSIDDIDLMVVSLPSLKDLLTRKEFGSRGTRERWEGNKDIVEYELSKFIHLLEKGNPNVITMLWLNSEHYLYKHPVMDKLIESRNLFLTQNFITSCLGYAGGQLKRMTAIGSYQGYMGEKRKRLVDKHGYDTKNASHLIRLLRMCKEVIDGLEIIVNRTDRDAVELLDIKKGAWSLDKVERVAGGLFGYCKANRDNSHIPNKPFKAGIEEIHYLMVSEVLLP